MHQKCLSYEMIPKLPDVGCGILRGGGLLFGDFTVFARLGTCVLALLGL